MQFLLWIAQLVRVLEARIRRRYSMPGLSQYLGHGKNFVWRIIKTHKFGPRVGALFRLLVAAGDEAPTDVFHHAFEQVRGEAPPLLACNRRHDGMTPSAFLIAMAPRVLAIIDAGACDSQVWRSRLAKIRQIERLRFRDRSLAQVRLERAIRCGVRLLEKSAVQPKAALGDLAYALACLAAMHRAAGRLDDAIDALLLAYPLSKLADDPLAEGLWYQKAAYVMVSLGRCDRAYEWVQDANGHFTEAQAFAEQARSVVDRGLVLSHQRQSEEVCVVLRRALRILPAEDNEYRFAAHQILALNLTALGQHEQALEELELAAELANEIPSLLAYVHWGRARNLRLVGQTQESIAAYQATIDLLRRAAEAADVAEATFEFADLLLQENMRPELQELSAAMSGHFSTIESELEVREAIEDLLALVSLKKLTRATLEALRRRLPEQTDAAGKVKQPALPQPPGLNSAPISASGSVRELLFGGKVPLSGSSTAA